MISSKRTFLIITRDGLVFPKNNQHERYVNFEIKVLKFCLSVRYTQLFGLSKPRKDKFSIRILLTDELAEENINTGNELL